MTKANSTKAVSRKEKTNTSLKLKLDFSVIIYRCLHQKV